MPLACGAGKSMRRDWSGKRLRIQTVRGPGSLGTLASIDGAAAFQCAVEPAIREIDRGRAILGEESATRERAAQAVRLHVELQFARRRAGAIGVDPSGLVVPPRAPRQPSRAGLRASLHRAENATT